MTMRFGVISLTSAPFEDLARRVRWFEDLGFDTAWVDDDLIRPGVSDYEAWTALGALARDTSHIRIGTLVSTIAFRHPTFLAAQAITVDHLSDGRVTLGLGSGACCPEFNALVGHGEWSSAERADRFAEQVEVLATLLRGEPVDHSGPHYPTVAPDPPKPVQRPGIPLVLAAHGSRGLRLAARHAAGWNCFGGQAYGGPARTFDEAVGKTREMLDGLDAACVEAGRDPRTISRSILAFAVRPDPLSSLDWFDEYVGRYEALGIDEISFFWPPFYHPDREPVPPDTTAAFERVAALRIGSRGDG
jgi:alkanesulfonate monooxygenase SsuD/methylene tetrahydromethanopterin reductase-like flavin-dependent oxidoreductase (luciferase family)